MVVKLLIYLLSIWLFTPHCQGRHKSWEDEYPFIKPASSFLDGDHDYDYIIVGGGAAGCPLAATLSHNFRVLLLERGDVPFDNVNISHFDNVIYNLMDTSPKSASQAFVSTDGVPNNRARVLGGGTCINGGFYSRASTRYFHHVMYIEEAGWDVELAHNSYTWIERQIVHQPKIKLFQRTFLNGLLEAGVLSFNGFTYDHHYGTKITGTIFDKYNRRHTAATLLASGKFENLEVLVHATVQKLLFTKIVLQIPNLGKRLLVTGVEFEDENQIRHQAFLSNDKGMKSEIILSSGTIGSPQILLLSGIGPRDDLLKLNISMVLENGFVGKSMFDCSTNYALVQIEGNVDISPPQVVGIAKEGVFIEAFGGLNFPAKVIQFGQEHDSTKKTLQAMHVNSGLNEISFKKELGGGYLLSKISKPISRGQMSLISKSVYDQPLVTFNYYRSHNDLSICVSGLQLLRKIVRTDSFKNITNNHKESNGPSIDFDGEESLQKLCKETVRTVYHYHGGCNMGRVVNNEYKVYGVDRLRVVDGSIFDESPGTNPQATLMMIGRYMGVKILINRLGINADKI
ncbi:protein HOTHEAD-like [Impatiens glandulifera]|uniref:protein HOTHEAD-like n=1 Tax=Impatiens glandulifera TaxID=253017 RepID=UPI001FB0AE57|nr:protein HOTHEAD-like [Impatiens glandulifera]